MPHLIAHAEVAGFNGKITGGCQEKGREGTIRVLDISSGQRMLSGSGRDDHSDFFYGLPRSHTPLTLCKQRDVSTPHLLKALTGAEPLFQVIIRLYRINDKGHEEHYYTITLENALAKGIIQSDELEYLSFDYEKIIWRHEHEGIEAEDSWQMLTAAGGAPVFAGRKAPTETETTTIDLSYKHADKSAVAGASYTVVATDRSGKDSGEFSYSGTLDASGTAHIEGVPLTPTGSYRYEFTSDSNEFEVAEEKKPQAKPDKKETKGVFRKAGEWIWDTAKGDFNQDQGMSNIAANSILGLIPVVDQALDIRDVIAGLMSIVDFYSLSGEEQDDKDKHPDTLGISYEVFLWIGVFLIAIGCIPILGSAVKGVFKGIIKFLMDNAKKAADVLTPAQVKKLWETSVAILNSFGKGNAHRFMKDIPGKLSGWLDEAETTLKKAMDKLGDLLAKAEDHAKKEWVQKLVPDETLTRIKTIRAALDRAAARISDMKAQVKDTLSQWMDKALSGKHTFETTGQTGRVESRVQKAMDPPEIDSPKPAKKTKGASDNDSMARGEPVNAVTGAVVDTHTDFVIPGRLPLAWERHYCSQSDDDSHLGMGWQCPADARLEMEDDGSVSFYHGTKSISEFPHLPVGKETLADTKNTGFLHQNATHYIILDKNNIGRHFRKRKNPSTLYLERIIDTKGNALIFRRDERGLTAIEDTSGQTVKVFSEQGRIRLMVRVMPDGTETKLAEYEYDQATGDLIAVYDTTGTPLRYQYDNHLLTRFTHRDGLSFHYDYDDFSPKGKCVHAWGDDGLYNYRFNYHERARQTKITNSLGYTEIITFDEDFKPLSILDHTQSETRYKYNDQGKTSAVIDPLGRKTSYDYDALGNVTCVTRPDGSTIRMAYDRNCNPVTITDPNGNVWKQRFEDRALLTGRISPTGAQTQYTYNKYGDLTTVTAPNGGVTRFEYDHFGNISAITHADGSTERFDRDPFGNIVSAHDPMGRKTHYVYDDAFRLTRIIKPSGGVVACEYDVEGRLISHTDEAGHTTRLAYTGLNQIKTRINPDGTKVHYRYDTEERLKTLTNERGEIYEFKRDHAGRITKEIDYWGNERTYSYDPAGQLLQSLDPLNRITQFKTDTLGRLIEKSFADGKTESFTFDPNGNLIAHENEHTRIDRIYDNENRLTQEILGGQATIHEYDALGNRTRRLSPLGNDIRFAYDILGRTTGISINDTDMTITRNALGLPVKEIFANGTERTYDYTADNQLADQVVILPKGNTISRSYEYDPVGNLTARIDADKGSRYFTYNPMGRITHYTDPEHKIREFLHDPAGDLFKLGDKEEFDGSRHITHDGTDYHFDAAGNLIERNGTRGHHTFTWDANNRLVSATNTHTGTQTVMTYDAQGRRLSKSTDNQTATFLWDGDQLLSDNIGGNNQREFVYYPGSFEPLAIIDQNKTINLIHTDSVGLPHEVTDASGALIWSASYDAMGSVESFQANGFDNPIRFQGQYYDPEIDLSYNRYRYFDAKTGSFVSQDPLGLAAGNNVYDYSPNVWGWVDPLGLCSENKPITDPARLLPEPTGSNPHLEGGPMTGVELPQGFRFNQAVGPGQKSPGAFGTPSEIPSVSFVRNDLAVIPDWKPTISGVRQVEVVRPVRAQLSIIGPQTADGIFYPGGKAQIQILEYDPSNPFVKFVGKEKLLK